MTDPHPTVAIIDVGSNSGRVAVLRRGTDDHLDVVADGRVPLRLARELRDSAHLSEEAMDRTIEAVQDFKAIANRAGAHRMIAVATSAVRDSVNADALIDRIEVATGITVEVIDGEREARCSFLGAIRGLPVTDGIMVDIGGGSVELSTFVGRTLHRSWTLPLGALRMFDRFLPSDPPAPDEIATLREHTASVIAEAGVPRLEEAGVLVGTGGTIRNLAKMDIRERSHPIQRVHGYSIPAARIIATGKQLANRTLRKRERLAGLKRDRADSVVGGALALACLMEHTRAPSILVSGQGLREGLAIEAFGMDIPSIGATREASVLALAGRFASWTPRAASGRAAITAAILDVVDPGGPQDEQEMLTYAAVLLDAGASIDAYQRAQHAAEIVASADLAGFSHRETAMLYLILRCADGDDAGLKAFERLLSEHGAITVAAYSTILSLADEIERRTRADDEVVCRVEGSHLIVEADVPPGWWLNLQAKRVSRHLGYRLVLLEKKAGP